jgi:hypothetical protein
MTYQLDDETKAKQFEGKLIVSGTLDKSTSVIRVSDIRRSRSVVGVRVKLTDGSSSGDGLLS